MAQALIAAALLGFAVMRSRASGSRFARVAAWAAAAVLVSMALTYVVSVATPNPAARTAAAVPGAVAAVVLAATLVAWALSFPARRFNRALDRRPDA